MKAGETISSAPARQLDISNLIGNSGLAYASTITMMGVGILTKVLLARTLTPSDLGVLITAQTFVLLVANLAQLSIPEALVRFVGRVGSESISKAAAFVSSALRCSIIATVSLCLLFACTAGVIADRWYHQPALKPVLILLSLAIPFTTATQVLTAVSRGFGVLWQKIVCNDLIPSVLVLGALLVLMQTHLGGLIGVSWVYLAASLFAAVIATIWFVNSPIGRVTPDRGHTSRELLRFSIPLMAANLVGWPIALIPLTLGRESFDAVAFYNLAIALSSLIYTIVGAAETAALPVWSSQIGRGAMTDLRADYASTSAWCMIAGSIVFAILFLRPAEVISLLYGTAYAKGASTLQWLAPVFLLNAATGPNESLLKALGATKWIFKARLAVGLSVIGAMSLLHNLPALPRGLASYWISSVIAISMYSAYLAASHRIHPITQGYLKAATAVLIALVASALLKPGETTASVIGSIAITATSYVGILFLALFVSGYLKSSDAEKFLMASTAIFRKAA